MTNSANGNTAPTFRYIVTARNLNTHRQLRREFVATGPDDAKSQARKTWNRANLIDLAARVHADDYEASVARVREIMQELYANEF